MLGWIHSGVDSFWGGCILGWIQSEVDVSWGRFTRSGFILGWMHCWVELFCVCGEGGGECHSGMDPILGWVHSVVDSFVGGSKSGMDSSWGGVILGWIHPGVDSCWVDQWFYLNDHSKQPKQWRKRGREIIFLSRAPWPDPPDSSKNPDLANFGIPDLPDSNKNPHLSNLRKQLTPH